MYTDVKGSIKKLQAVGIEPTTFCVLSRCDNHYTTLAVM